MPAIAAIGSRIDAATLARLARRTPEPLLRAATLPPLRRAVTGEIFRRMPRQLKPTAGASDAVVRWDVREAGGGRTETWFLVLEDGRARTSREPPATNPRTTISLTILELLQLATGAAAPIEMFQRGRIRISGDLWFAAQLSSMFEIPA